MTEKQICGCLGPRGDSAGIKYKGPGGASPLYLDGSDDCMIIFKQQNSSNWTLKLVTLNCMVLVAVCRLSLVVASGDYSQAKKEGNSQFGHFHLVKTSHCLGFSYCREGGVGTRA